MKRECSSARAPAAQSVILQTGLKTPNASPQVGALAIPYRRGLMLALWRHRPGLFGYVSPRENGVCLVQVISIDRQLSADEVEAFCLGENAITERNHSLRHPDDVLSQTVL